MITINVKAIITYAIFFAAVWWGHPVWLALAAELVAWPSVRTFGAGFIAGCFVPIAIGFNMGLRLRRDQMIDRANQDYDKDKRKIYG